MTTPRTSSIGLFILVLSSLLLPACGGTPDHDTISVQIVELQKAGSYDVNKVKVLSEQTYQSPAFQIDSLDAALAQMTEKQALRVLHSYQKTDTTGVSKGSQSLGDWGLVMMSGEQFGMVNGVTNGLVKAYASREAFNAALKQRIAANVPPK